MNSDNYCSLEMSRRLVAAGIVLETDFYHYVSSDYPNESTIISKKDRGSYGLYKAAMLYPAPNLSELWRELPQGIPYKGEWAEICVTKDYKDNDATWCSYNLPDDRSVCGSKKQNTNPCDCLAELLIWIKKEGRDEHSGKT